MPDDEIYDPSDNLEDDGILDASDTLDGNPGDDPLDTGIAPADRWSAGEGFGTTLAEERAGESLDQLLAEEERTSKPWATLCSRPTCSNTPRNRTASGTSSHACETCRSTSIRPLTIWPPRPTSGTRWPSTRTRAT